MSDALINGVAGAGGGIIAQLITYPLLTVNTRQQTERDPSRSAAGDGAVRQILEVVKQEGWGRLYGGLAPSLVGTAASQTHKKTSNGPPIHALSCLREEAVNLAVVEHQPCRTSDVVQELYNEAGLWGFWKGVVPTLIMVSNPSIQFMLYETLIKKVKRRRALNTKGAEGFTALEARLQVKQGLHDDKRRQYTENIFGGVSNLRPNFPLDFVGKPIGTYDAITKMIHYEGLSGLYKGMGTKIVQGVFAAAVLFMVKEELVKAARVLVTRELRPINNSRLKTPS
ncbi:mitochondrial substrate carrier family protein [Musa troglodytarum]|uniref:Mitochondrial substrate carrier family protein n=1 Tax=Musa troglodytarum TaxID=320322 RepID=A0A9E7IEQ7_9LILI|nr:mitochondrial substrate carrier family protein [Musa troglodytarum]